MKVYICIIAEWYTNADFGTDPGKSIEKIFDSEDKAKAWVEETRERWIVEDNWVLEDIDDPNMTLTDEGGMTTADIYYEEYDIE